MRAKCQAVGHGIRHFRLFSYSAAINACDSGKQGYLKLDMITCKAASSYGATISTYDKGKQWYKALELLGEAAVMPNPQRSVTYEKCKRWSSWMLCSLDG